MCWQIVPANKKPRRSGAGEPRRTLALGNSKPGSPPKAAGTTYGVCGNDGLRLRPGLLRRPHLFQRPRQPKHSEIIEPSADDLDADRQSVLAEGPIQRGRGLLGHVVGHGEGDVRQGVARIVVGGGKLGLVGQDGRVSLTTS